MTPERTPKNRVRAGREVQNAEVPSAVPAGRAGKVCDMSVDEVLAMQNDLRRGVQDLGLLFAALTGTRYSTTDQEVAEIRDRLERVGTSLLWLVRRGTEAEGGGVNHAPR